MQLECSADRVRERAYLLVAKHELLRREKTRLTVTLISDMMRNAKRMSGSVRRGVVARESEKLSISPTSTQRDAHFRAFPTEKVVFLPDTTA